jgi:hypothetical protein
MCQWSLFDMIETEVRNHHTAPEAARLQTRLNLTTSAANSRSAAAGRIAFTNKA